jgi:hypothetical protein
LRHRVLDQRAQLDGPIGHLEILQPLADVVRRQAEQGPRAVVGEAQYPVRPDHDARQRIGLEGKNLKAIVDRHRGSSLLALRQRQHVANVERYRLGEHPPLELHRREELAVRQQQLGAAL